MSAFEELLKEYRGEVNVAATNFFAPLTDAALARCGRLAAGQKCVATLDHDVTIFMPVKPPQELT